VEFKISFAQNYINILIMEDKTIHKLIYPEKFCVKSILLYMILICISTDEDCKIPF